MASQILTAAQITTHALAVLERELFNAPDYYPKRKYGKWTIYNKDGMRVVWGLNEKAMKNYMKLLKKEE
jgi:hypothetical protein